MRGGKGGGRCKWDLWHDIGLLRSVLVVYAYGIQRWSISSVSEALYVV